MNQIGEIRANSPPFARHLMAFVAAGLVAKKDGLAVGPISACDFRDVAF